MDNENIENIGASAVETYFARTKRIVPELRRADKKPLYDGVLRLYKSEKHSNNTYLGDVNVQIKTHDSVSDSSEISVQIDRIDLETYKRNGGVLYFEVFIGNEACSTIYCADLFPLSIKKYLENTQEDCNPKVLFKQLPEKRSDFEKEIFKFYSDSIYQASSYDKPIVQIGDFLAKPGEKHFVIYSPITEINNNPYSFLGSEFNTIYATDADGNILFPIGDGRYKVIKIGKNNNPISIKGKVYYDYSIVQEIDGNPCMVIDQFLFCSFFPAICKRQLSYKSHNKKARARLKELDFILALNESKALSIGGEEMPCEEFILEDKVANMLKADRDNCAKIVRLLDALHVSEDLNFNSLSQDDRLSFNKLYEGIILNKHITIEDEPAGLKIICIGPLKIFVVFSFVSEGVFHIEDFFTSPHVLCYDDNEHTYLSSRYSILSVQDMIDASNFHFDGVVESYKTLIGSNPNIVQVAYRDLQRYILAYDLTEGKKKEFLRIAHDLVTWLIEIEAFDGNDIRLDLYQIKKRSQTLSIEEIKDIYLIEDSTNNSFSKIACNILTDNRVKVDMLISDLSEEDQALLSSAPISHLIKNNN